MTISGLMDVILGFRPVHRAYDLRSCNRFDFRFAEQATDEMCDETGLIVFPVNGPSAEVIAREVRNAGVCTDFHLHNYFRGRFRSSGGSIYDGRSITVHLVLLNKRELLALSTTLLDALDVESVLMQHGGGGEIYFVAHSRP
jgi:hypothetical protein